MGIMYKSAPEVRTVEVWNPPVFRFAAPSGTIVAGTKITVNVTVTNPDGSQHILYFPYSAPSGEVMQVPIDGGEIVFDKPAPEGMEVLAVLSMDFQLSPLPNESQNENNN